MENIRRPTNIPGYVHPTKTNYNNGVQYKTFTEGQKTRKFGTIDLNKSTYSSYNTVYGENSEDNICPICTLPAFSTSDCVYNVRKCQNNHFWYINRDGKIKTGNPS